MKTSKDLLKVCESLSERQLILLFKDEETIEEINGIFKLTVNWIPLPGRFDSLLGGLFYYLYDKEAALIELINRIDVSELIKQMNYKPESVASHYGLQSFPFIYYANELSFKVLFTLADKCPNSIFRSFVISRERWDVFTTKITTNKTLNPDEQKTLLNTVEPYTVFANLHDYFLSSYPKVSKEELEDYKKLIHKLLFSRPETAKQLFGEYMKTALQEPKKIGWFFAPSTPYIKLRNQLATISESDGKLLFEAINIYKKYLTEIESLTTNKVELALADDLKKFTVELQPIGAGLSWVSEKEEREGDKLKLQ